ncbi:glycosyl hydrolase family 28-related protein [Streptomyces sp. NPDC048281]|uniref:glycosyl hydrolase family 28-related protein n=1 Tax=Streptomyces sp. NPDC048281 TaxID=3154715 RepID=UPI003416AD35
MARRVFPQDRMAYRTTGPGSLLYSADGTKVTVYADAACTVLADIQALDGSALPGSVITVDATSLLPRFLGPTSGTDVLWVPGARGVAVELDAEVQTRVETAEATLNAHLADPDAHGDRTWAQAQFDPSGAASAAQAAAVTAAATDATSKVSAHVSATDPHGDRAWAALQFDAAGAASSAQTAAAADAASKYTPLTDVRLTNTYNVQAYLAKGDDTTDDYAAIMAAINACPEGGVVLFPPGNYRISQPLQLKRNRTYRGTHAPRWQYRGGSPCVIKPHPSFTASKIIHVADKEITGAASDNDGGRIENLAVLGQNAGSSVVGILFEGLVRDWAVRNVDVSNTSGNGWQTLGYASSDTTTHYPRGLDLYSVTSYAAHNNGFSLSNLTDSTIFDALAVSASSIGFLIDNPGEIKYIGCRAVFNASDGFRITGSVSVGGAQFIGCSTDRNQSHGVRITAGGSQPLTFTDLLTRRDGKNSNAGGGGFAGLALIGTSGTTVCPVVVSGLSQTVGVDDGATSTGNDSPQYGVRAEYAKHLAVRGTAWGVTNAVFDNGNNTSLDLAGLYRQNGLAAARAVETGVVGTQPGVAAASGAGTSPPAPTLSNTSDDRAGLVNLGTGTAPATGSQATVTFARTKARTPVVIAVPSNAATNARQVGVSNVSSTGFNITFGVAGTASQATGTYQAAYAVYD